MTGKNEVICGKASDAERQLRDRVLEVCCEELMAKLSRQEAKTMEEERSRQERDREESGEERAAREREEEDRGRINWADMEDDGNLEGGEMCVDLGGSIQVVQDEGDEQEWGMLARRMAGGTTRARRANGVQGRGEKHSSRELWQDEQRMTEIGGLGKQEEAEVRRGRTESGGIWRIG